MTCGALRLEGVMRNYSCLTAGDIIEIGYHTLTFRLLIMEITPPGPAISVLDTDLEVDFAPPVGYVEPEYKRPSESLPSMREKFNLDTKGMQDVDARGSGTATPSGASAKGKGKEKDDGSAAAEAAAAASWEAFKGTGNSLGGKRIKGKGIKAKGIEGVDENSRIFRTESVLPSASRSRLLDLTCESMIAHSSVSLFTQSTAHNHCRHADRHASSPRRAQSAFRRPLLRVRSLERAPPARLASRD